MLEVKLMLISALIITLGVITLCAYGIQYFTDIPFPQAMIAVGIVATLFFAFMSYKDGRRMNE